MKNIRNMKEADAKTLADMEKELFPDSWSRTALLETYKQNHAKILLAEEADEILGYVIVYCVLDEAEIARIAVSPKRRRQGVGRCLLDELRRMGKEQGISRILLDVRESNRGARAFYEAYGFAQDGIRRNYYQQPEEHAILMSLPIVE